MLRCFLLLCFTVIFLFFLYKYNLDVVVDLTEVSDLKAYLFINRDNNCFVQGICFFLTLLYVMYVPGMFLF
jgi:hypothetical protein